MIRKTSGGYQVLSKSGRPLSKPGVSKHQAERRLKQVEYFKRKRMK